MQEAMHLKELSEKCGYCVSALRVVLCRPEFKDIKLYKGELFGVTDFHIGLLRIFKKNRLAKRGFYGEKRA